MKDQINCGVQYSREEEPIVISKFILDLFLKQNKPADLMALYAFYYHTAKWQKTNQPKATLSYTAKGLKWTEEKTRERKKVLKKLGLIKDIIHKDQEGKIRGHYIKVKFVWGTNADTDKTTKNHPTEKPPPGKNHPLEVKGGNALNPNRENALNPNRENTGAKILFLKTLQFFPIQWKKSNEFCQTWRDWIQHRKEIHHRLTSESAKRQCKILAQHKIEIAIAMIEQSITNGWQGLFPIKDFHSVKETASQKGKVDIGYQFPER